MAGQTFWVQGKVCQCPAVLTLKKVLLIDDPSKSTLFRCDAAFHSFVRSIVCSFIHSLIHSFVSFHFMSCHFNSIQFHFMSFHSFIHSFILSFFHSIPFHSIPFHSIPFHSIPFHSIHSFIYFISFISFVCSFIRSFFHNSNFNIQNNSMQINNYKTSSTFKISSGPTCGTPGRG